MTHSFPRSPSWRSKTTPLPKGFEAVKKGTRGFQGYRGEGAARIHNCRWDKTLVGIKLEGMCWPQPSSFVPSRCCTSKEYPGISKNSARQRLISSHSHLAGKLAGGVLTGHPQVLSSYQYEAGVPLANSDSQDPVSNHFPPSRDPGLLYHCFKHRGTFSASPLFRFGANHYECHHLCR